MFTLSHLNTRANWENSCIKGKCITVSNSPNSSSCLDKAMLTRKKSSVSFIKYFSKIIRQMEENAVF